ncbi:MAG: hypothetical protein ACI9PU_002464, partial [Ascidiaceihabitans sp.]
QTIAKQLIVVKRIFTRVSDLDVYSMRRDQSVK